MKPEELIGWRFRWNKYGLTLWEDRIAEIGMSMKLLLPPKIDSLSKGWFKAYKEAGKLGYQVVPAVRGENTKNWYEIHEIVIYPDNK